MSDTTARCGLPLLQPAQAQKHVTVNDALMRLDGLVNLVLQSTVTTTPPAAVLDGASYAVPPGALAAWAGKDDLIATGANGGWVFTQPQPGQRAFIADLGVGAVWSGKAWIAGALTLGAFGGGLIAGQIEAEFDLSGASPVGTPVIIPERVMVIGVTARITKAFQGTATSWKLGTADAPDRFGSGLGMQANSWGSGLLSAPCSYYSPAPLVMTGTGGTLTGGRVRLCVHYLELRLMDAAA